MDWVGVAQDRDRWRAVPNVLSCRVFSDIRKSFILFLASLALPACPSGESSIEIGREGIVSVMMTHKSELLGG
jgi:hypothetical protein